MRAFHWAATPLGPVSTWSQSLRTAVGICLSSRYRMVIWWVPTWYCCTTTRGCRFSGPTSIPRSDDPASKCRRRSGRLYLVQQRYWQGIANDRPFQYWSWANIASVVCAIGLGSVAGVSKVFDAGAIRRRSGIHLLVLAALIAILFADLSMLSKAETERIWLPFTIWLTAAPALLPRSSHRWWLAVNIAGALLLNHLFYTNW